MGDVNARKAQLGEILSEAQIYQDYREAFRKATGLPLTLSSPGETQSFGSELNQSPFCALMARTKESCAACHALQSDLGREAQLLAAADKRLMAFSIRLRSILSAASLRKK